MLLFQAPHQEPLRVSAEERLLRTGAPRESVLWRAARALAGWPVKRDASPKPAPAAGAIAGCCPQAAG